jgi:very-short-patch-repair endonuclease
MTTTLSRTVDARIARAATSGFPVVTRRRLRQAGIHRDSIAVRLATGSLVRLWDDTFLVGVHDPSDLAPDLITRAAVASVEPYSMLSGVSAIERRTGWGRFDRCIHVTSDRFHRDQPRWHVTFRRTTNTCELADVECVRGMPTATPVRALLQAARDLSPHQAANAIRQLRHHERISVSDVERALDEDGRRVLGAPTVRRAIELLSEGSAGTKSRSEDALLPHVSGMYGEPLVNVRGATGITDYEPDMCWWHARCIVEIDGGHHVLDPAIEAADRDRDALLRGMGWVVVRIHWRRVWIDLDEVLREIEDAFAGRRGFEMR